MSEDDSKIVEEWACARIARSDGAATTPRRTQHLAEVSAAESVISAFVKSLKEGADPWETRGDGMYQLVDTDNPRVADLVAGGLRRRGFPQVDVHDAHERYYVFGERPPEGLGRWMIVVLDPILAVSP